jgi:hypothetical protein
MLDARMQRFHVVRYEYFMLHDARVSLTDFSWLARDILDSIWKTGRALSMAEACV